MLYVYGMRLRGFAPACQPMDGLVDHLSRKGSRYHDLLVYKRKLTEEERKTFELDFLLSVSQRMLAE